MLKTRIKQLGQGMTEYIIIVALIAIAAIAVYGLFGDTVRQQMGIMTGELAGSSVSTTRTTTTDIEAADDAAGLKDFED